MCLFASASDSHRNAEDLSRQAQNILNRARKQDDEERERLRRQQEEKLAMLEKIRQEEVCTSLHFYCTLLSPLYASAHDAGRCCYRRAYGPFPHSYPLLLHA